MSVIHSTLPFHTQYTGLIPKTAGLVAAVAAWLLFKAWLLWITDVQLHYDEAQYWEWSQHLDWGYYSKGPLLAWLIALSEHFFGKGEWQVRLFSWLAHGGFLCMIYYFTRSIFRSNSAAGWAVVIAATTPVYFILGSVMTTDNFLLLFWTWALWAIYRALVQGANRAWYEAGIAVGLGALTKLTIGLLPVAVFIVMSARGDLRPQLRNRHLWLGVLLALLCVSPMLIWNYHHDWVLFRHEGRRLLEAAYAFSSFGTFILGQALALSPIIAITAAVTLYRRPAAPELFLVWGVSTLLLLFFLLKAFSTELEVNWPAPIYIGWIVLFAGMIQQRHETFRLVVAGGVVLSALLLAVVYFPGSVGISHRDLVPVRNVMSWREPIQKLYASTSRVDFIVVENYPLAAELAFYWPAQVPVYVAGGRHRRFNQHDLWPGMDQEAGNTGLFIGLDGKVPPLLADAFAGCQSLPPVVAADAGEWMRVLHAQLCNRYIPIDWPQPDRY